MIAARSHGYRGAMPARLVIAWLGSVALHAAAVAQTTLIVGPGFYPNVDSAVAAASPGDIIRVLPGAYPSFAVNKGVTIHGSPGATFSGIFPPIANVPLGQIAHFEGLQLPGLGVNGGTISVDNCQIGPNGMSTTLGAVVVMQGCTIQVVATLFPQPALGVTNSEVTLVDCSVVAISVNPLAAALPAIRVANGRFRGSRLNVTGPPGTATLPGGAAIGGELAHQVWVSDSTLASGDPAVCAITASTGRHDRCVLTPNCSALASGLVLGASRPLPLQNGVPWSAQFMAAPGMAIGVAAAPEFFAQSYVQLEQSLLLPAASAFPLDVLVTDAQGVATGTWSVPAGPLFVDRVVWLQGFTGFAYPLQASPLVGGVVR